MGFPHKVWDGTSAERPNLDTVQPPGHRDWIALVREVQAMQQYILTLASNIKTMPTLGPDLQKAKDQLTQLVGHLATLEVPDDLRALLATLQSDIVKLDIREDHNCVKKALNKLFLRTRVLERAYKEFCENLAHQFEVFTNELRNQVYKESRAVDQRYKVLQEQVRELQIVLQEPDLG